MSRSESLEMIQRVESLVETTFQGGTLPKLVAGISGGPDSMALLYICHRIGLPVTVVHCNYQLRGAASEEDQKLVEESASMWGFEVISIRFDREESSDNFQNRARELRYQAFRDLKQELNADAISTAHHQDDQLETILQKILRGSGLSAWKGMSVWDGELFRPLLAFSKETIMQFVSDQHVPYRIDNSNEESAYARNFLRNGWFPQLDELFPGWRTNLLRIPDRADEYSQLADLAATTVMADEKSIDRKRFLELDPALRPAVLHSILSRIDRSITPSHGRLTHLGPLESIQTGKQIQIDGNWHLLRDRNRLIIRQESFPEYDPLELTQSRLSGDEYRAYGFGFQVAPWGGKIDPEQLQLDADNLNWPVTLRPRKDGDKFRPIGMNGHQTVADFLTNRKVPAVVKPHVLVLEQSGGKIAAVLVPDTGESDGNDTPGTIAEQARCGDQTGRVLQVRPLADSGG
ncbi:MAG: tRNA lysidine(34) synthetase TilS [Balneolaceae bacterium]